VGKTNGSRESARDGVPTKATFASLRTDPGVIFQRSIPLKSLENSIDR
jgi:hypothetical protein